MRRCCCSTAVARSGSWTRELSGETVTRPATSYTRAGPTWVSGPSATSRAGDRRQGPGRRAQPDEFAGRLLAPAHLPQEQAQRGGHIPTAVSVPWSKAANDDGTFKSDEDLKELYSGAGLDLSTDIIAYCRIGERSAHTWFVLHEILGQPNEELRRFVDGIRFPGRCSGCCGRRARPSLTTEQDD